MNAERLLLHYEQIADAPDAIARLRRFILDLAVRGKLVPQDPADEPASMVLRRINARVLPDGAFPLPALWAWIDVAAVADARLGKMLDKAKNKGVPRTYLRNINVRWFDFDLSDLQEMPFEDTELAEFTLRAGDVLICEGGEPGRAAVWDERAQGVYFQKAIHRVRFTSLVDSTFFVYALKASANDGRLAESFTGTGIKHFTGKGLSGYRFPLPPLAEQHRIVAKADELMALCDALEAARTEREAKRDRLAAASLARLNTPDPETFRDDARFALDALPALTARPDQIKTLRQTILNLAVRGKLSVHDDWVDSPVRVGDVATLQNGYAFKSEWFTKSGTRLVRNANVGHGTLNWAETVCLPESMVPEFERFRLCEGDVVVSLDRPFIVTGTKVARISSSDLPALLLQRVGRFVLSSNLRSDFLYLWINSPHFTEQIDPGRSNGVPHISSKQVEAAIFFLPPLAEQHRIVAQVDELMALCDQLESSLTSADETRKKLLDALLAEALAPVDTEALQEAAE
ncbi:restriction endonuclease subunit S [Pararhizobium sp. LjRoot238]|uniref:restriction endonuclease subunit S n=1 Tax=Pararhizobium sp. LjRoot238 TaxID=3342293 RepID=UPI003ECE2C35